MAAVLRSRPRVPICAVGTWMTATGEWEVTAAMLADAVLAQHDPSFRSGVLKLGHVDPRFTDGQLLGDGQPAVGRLENLTTDGRQLYADLEGIPAWLDEIADTAYPSRSIEALTGVETAGGAQYLMVVTGLALLGETVPAIETLGDLADLFGVPTDVAAYTASSRVAASATPGGPMPTRALGQVVAAGASIDELIRSAEEWAEDQPMLGDCWVRDVGTDWVVFTVWMPGGESRLYRCSWSEQGGNITFGTPERVRPTYEPVPEATAVAARAHDMSRESWDVSAACLRREHGRAVLSRRGRDITASSTHPQETSVPISPALAAALGVSEDADDDTVLQAVESLRTPPPPAEQQTSQEGGTTDTQPAPANVEALVAAAVRRHTEPILASLTTATTELAGIKAERAAAAKDAALNGAVTAGKIRPADRDSWAARYDAAPDVITEVLASIAPGTAVPVSAAGITGGEVTGGEAFTDAEYLRIFGDSEKAGL